MKTGTMYDVFQPARKMPVLSDWLNNNSGGSANSAASDFNNRFGIPSGPEPLDDGANRASKGETRVLQKS